MSKRHELNDIVDVVMLRVSIRMYVIVTVSVSVSGRVKMPKTCGQIATFLTLPKGH